MSQHVSYKTAADPSGGAEAHNAAEDASGDVDIENADVGDAATSGAGFQRAIPTQQIAQQHAAPLPVPHRAQIFRACGLRSPRTRMRTG